MDRPDSRGGVPLHEAADLLGVTVELLRKRAQRKTVPAYKVDGRWYVVLDGIPNIPDTTFPGPVQDRTASPGQDEPHHAAPVVSPAARLQLEAIRDEWLRPLVDRIGELEREAGQLQERVRGVERERDTFQTERDAALAEVDRLRAAQDALSSASWWTAGAERAEPAPAEARPLREPGAPIGPPAWRTTTTAGAKRKPWWRVWWERWQ